MSEASDNPPGAEVKGKAADIEMRSVPVEFSLPDDLRTEYADVFNVFFTDYDFTLTFLQSQSPLIFKDEDWEAVKTVKAVGVARVVIPPHIIPRIFNVLKENWDKFMEIRQKQLQEKQQQESKNVNADADERGDASA